MSNVNSLEIKSFCMPVLSCRVINGIINKIPMNILRFVFSPILWILSVIYVIILNFKQYLYKNNILKTNKLPAKILCVGNITVGGTGKTSLVLFLSKVLQKKHKITILTRGYKRKSRNGYLIVSDGKNILTDVKDSGDEPYLLAEKLENVPVIVGADRYSAGKIALNKFNVGTLLLDDGYQHLQLSRNLDILLIDCLNPFGNGFCLPLGLLREPLESMARAGIIILTHCNLVEKTVEDSLVEKIKRYNNSAVIATCVHKPVNFIRFADGEKIATSYFSGREVSVLSSIGNPPSFEKTLVSLNAKINNRYNFTDHHWYRAEEIKNILSINEFVITTEKDSVKLENFKDGADKEILSHLFTLQIEIEIMENKEKCLEKIEKILET